MAKERRGKSLGQLHTLFNVGTVGGLSDGQLLEWYTSRGGEAAELAFSALVERHGPMVLRVCRSLVRDEHEAQDAFQATFLVLVRRAGSLWVRDSLGPWLHEVACRVASCARSAAARRRRIERRAAESAVASHVVSEVGSDLRSILHEEIGRLPEPYRAAIVLCGLEGLTHDQAARKLGWPLGTLQSRLARGRQRLRGRLARRGFALLAGPLGAVLAREAAAASSLPYALVEQATRAAVAPALAIGKGASAGVVSAAAIELMEGALKTMSLIRFKKIGLFTLLLGIATACAGVAARQPVREPSPTVPGEQTRVTLPAHVVEPPDMIHIEVHEALSGQPITGERLVRPDGTVSLGFYGDLFVAGLTTMEIKTKVIRHLQKYLSDEQLGLIVPDPDRAGKFKVVPAIDSVRVYVEVTSYNSKMYYVMGEVAEPGRMYITGNDTVLDAINYAGGLLPTATRQDIRLVRPPGSGSTERQIFRVDYPAIVYKGDPSTNYQLLPGDRLIVLRDENLEAAHEAPAFDQDVPPASRPESSLGKNKPDPASAELQALTRRLDQLERKLDRLIEHPGGSSSPPPTR
ncbi:sigma-70 family RNA polymerase sigma factor [Singulisphaera sp. GP187]|uniref:sigma-70 family RNA polymerase sigma factor n=1 Tax=Singulisphaera sp. GP187 TaxID=1882752 RepID=UPI0020B105B8|nr:sigma-70 family RNA polymerase sigma factor [Singulisphaera sp. GP187]